MRSHGPCLIKPNNHPRIISSILPRSLTLSLFHSLTPPSPVPTTVHNRAQPHSTTYTCPVRFEVCNPRRIARHSSPSSSLRHPGAPLTPACHLPPHRHAHYPTRRPRRSMRHRWRANPRLSGPVPSRRGRLPPHHGRHPQSRGVRHPPHPSGSLAQLAQQDRHPALPPCSARQHLCTFTEREVFQFRRRFCQDRQPQPPPPLRH